MTVKLYYDDPCRVEFDARILERRSLREGIGLVLDRTCFYPTSGGQPCDRGWLDQEPVLDVFEDGEYIVHAVGRDIPGDEVRGRLDWPRRFDHMQQHTGQHILSEAFAQVLGANTVSFHLGDELSTIDLDVPALAAEDAARVEELANQIVQQNRPVQARFYREAELIGLPLRKAPPQTDRIRLVTIQDFDCTPCGGTHCLATGSVGLIKIRRWERRGQETRVEFLCGGRALRDYAWKHEAISQLAVTFGVKDREVVDAVLRLSEEAGRNRKELEALRNLLLDYEAETLAAKALHVEGIGIVQALFQNRDQEEVRRLALRIVSSPGKVAILGIAGEKGRLVLARSADVPGDMTRLLREVCHAFGGGGGGQPHLAQGGGLNGARLEEALKMALFKIQAILEENRRGEQGT